LAGSGDLSGVDNVVGAEFVTEGALLSRVRAAVA